jgi:HlyD family secretion protein
MQNPAKKGLPMSRLKEFRTKLSERADKNSAVIKFRKAFAKIPRAVRWAILGIIVLGLAGGGYAIYRNSQATTVTASTDAAMQTAVARRSSIVITASGSGTLIPRDEASAGFGASGKITQVYVKVGDEVAAGQVLAEMDSATAQSSYTSARLDYLNMTSPAAIANAEQAVLTAQTSLTSARNNLAYVISPTVLYWQEEALKAQAALPAAQSAAAADPTDENQKKVEEAQAALDKAEAGLTWAWGYYRNTYVPEYFTVTETDQRTGVETVVYVTNSNGELVPEIEAPSQATIDAALAAVKGEAIPDDATGSALAQLISAKDNYESAKLQLDGIKLVAPIAGTVMSFSAKVGDEAGTTAIVQISDLSQPYYLEAYFDESDWTNIQVGYETNVTFDLLPDSTFAGKVVEVTPGLVSGGGSSLVHAYIELTDTVPSGLPSGTAATVEVVAGRATNVITVPVEAVREISAGQYAVFVVENGTPKLRMVEVGLSDITTAEILSGLNEGEVVTTGIVETLP